MSDHIARAIALAPVAAVLCVCATPSHVAEVRTVNRAPTFRVEKVENGGLLFTDNQAGVSGVDCGYSLPIGGHTLWFFGDIFLLHPTDPSGRYVGGVSNAALVVPAGGVASLRKYHFLADPVTGLARQVIPNAPGEGTETRIWPFGGWYDSVARRAYVYYGRVRTTGGGGPFDFRVEGHGLAASAVSRMDAIQFERLRTSAGRELWWEPPADLYGAAVVSGTPESDPYIYIVGVHESKGAKTARLARVNRSRIADLSAYEYLCALGRQPQWSARPADAVDVEGLRDFPSELSVSHNRFIGGYLAVHSVGITERIRLSVAREPWGPYRPIAEIGAPHRAFERAFCYAGKEHQELAEQGGRVIYVTYVDSQRYWLRLLKVTLAR